MIDWILSRFGWAIWRLRHRESGSKMRIAIRKTTLDNQTLVYQFIAGLGDGWEVIKRP